MPSASMTRVIGQPERLQQTGTVGAGPGQPGDLQPEDRAVSARASRPSSSRNPHGGWLCGRTDPRSQVDHLDAGGSPAGRAARRPPVLPGRWTRRARDTESGWTGAGRSPPSGQVRGRDASCSPRINRTARKRGRCACPAAPGPAPAATAASSMFASRGGHLGRHGTHGGMLRRARPARRCQSPSPARGGASSSRLTAEILLQQARSRADTSTRCGHRSAARAGRNQPARHPEVRVRPRAVRPEGAHGTPPFPQTFLPCSTSVPGQEPAASRQPGVSAARLTAAPAVPSPAISFLCEFTNTNIT